MVGDYSLGCGARGLLVSRLQGALQHGTDGIFGSKTKAALMAAQRQAGRPATGRANAANFEAAGLACPTDFEQYMNLVKSVRGYRLRRLHTTDIAFMQTYFMRVTEEFWRRARLSPLFWLGFFTNPAERLAIMKTTIEKVLASPTFHSSAVVSHMSMYQRVCLKSRRDFTKVDGGKERKRRNLRYIQKMIEPRTGVP